MTGLDQLIGQLAGQLAPEVSALQQGLVLRVDELDLDIPIEYRISPTAELLACAPRGRLATGFGVPHGRLRARLVRGGS